MPIVGGMSVTIATTATTVTIAMNIVIITITIEVAVDLISHLGLERTTPIPTAITAARIIQVIPTGMYRMTTAPRHAITMHPQFGTTTTIDRPTGMVVVTMTGVEKRVIPGKIQSTRCRVKASRFFRPWRKIRGGPRKWPAFLILKNRVFNS